LALKKEGNTVDWRKLHSKELHDLDSSPDFIWLIKRRRMIWVRHAARVGEKGNVYSVWVTKTEDLTPP
jgi:hypothetical protein